MFRVKWQSGDDAIRAALAVAPEPQGAAQEEAGRDDPASARIEQLEAALAKSNLDYEKALGRALRAEMRT